MAVHADLDLQKVLDEQRRTVDTDFFDLSIRELARMATEKEISIAPEFQRQFRWDADLQSALIESFLLGLPVPAIFVATNPDGTWEVVDGLQRICTILRFMGVNVPDSPALQFAEDVLELSSMATLSGFQGASYEKLPRPIKLMFDRRYLRVQVLSDKSDREVRYELFRRLNVGAVRLTPQEIRGCVYRGPFNSMLQSLAESKELRSLLKLQRQNQNNATAEELVLKYFAYRDWSDRFDGKVTDFLNKYMGHRADDHDVSHDYAQFRRVCNHLLEATGGGPFLRSKTSITPQNQFEAVMVGIGRQLEKGVEPTLPSPGWQDDEELVSRSTKGTNTRSSFHGRLDRAERLFSPA